MRWTVRGITVIAACAVVAAGCGDADEPEPTTVSVTTTPSTTTATTPASPTEAEAAVPPDDSAGNPEAADDPGADRPRSVEDVITAVLTGSETPATICDSLVTPEYVATAYGDRAGCVAAQRSGALADSVETRSVEETEDGADAVVVPAGGPYDGVDVEVRLLPAADLEGAWVIDSLSADVPAGP